jgi:hypothetical protein
VDDARVARVRAALADPTVRAFDEVAAERLARELDDPQAADELVAAGRHGALACFLPDPPPGARRRILELDRTGAVVAALRWNTAGGLDSAAVRTGLGAWIGVVPRGTSHAAWGPSDQLWTLTDGPRFQRSEPLTAFQSVDWSAITHIPPLAEPARLPASAGTAVLNLLAALAKDQGMPRLRYRGPYPTEGLFTALLESFRFAPSGRHDPSSAHLERRGPQPRSVLRLANPSNPLQAFLDGRLEWVPAPHERHFTAPGVCVQLRERLEKVVLDGRMYYRHDWQTVRRHAPRRVHDVGDGVRCSLWALETAIEEHAVLSRSGDLVTRVPPMTATRPAVAIPAPVRDGIAAVLCATSAAALGGEIRRIVNATPLWWAPVVGDLVALDRDCIKYSWRLAETAATQFRIASSRPGQLARGLELIAEMAALAGDAVRSRAQEALSHAPPEAQEAALAAEEEPDAEAIARAAEAVISTVDPAPE